MAEVKRIEVTRELLDDMFDFEVEFEAAGTRREDGLTAAEVTAELKSHKEKMTDGS